MRLDSWPRLLMDENVVAPTHADRCDRCGAQAFIRAVMLPADLLFCGHHGAKYMAALEKQAMIVQDYRETINAKPSPAAY